MKTASDAVKNLLSTSTQFYMCNLYTFTLLSGVVQYYCDLDVDVTWNSITYSSKGLNIKRGKITLTKGNEVDTLEIAVYPTTAQIGGIGWLAAIGNGALDGASVTVQRLFFSGSPVAVAQTQQGYLTAADGSPLLVETAGTYVIGVNIANTPASSAVGTITLFTGKVSDIDPLGRTAATLKVTSTNELFNINWPINVYDPGCVWPLYSAGCGLLASAFTVAGTVSGTPTSTNMNTNLTQASNYFNGGVVAMTSGALTGSRFTVKAYSNTNGAIQPVINFVNLPSAGDTFNIYPGCDRTMATCTNVFNNIAQYRGFPFIPIPETGVY